MARMTQSRVTGLGAARALLKQLPKNVQKRVLNQATRAGARELQLAVRRVAPVDLDGSELAEKFGPLKTNIRIVRLKRGVPKDRAEYRVDTGDSPQGFWREFGTAPHKGKMTATLPSGRKLTVTIDHPGQPARPWFRPAVDGAWSNAVARIKQRLARGVEREAEKLGKSQR